MSTEDNTTLYIVLGSVGGGALLVGSPILIPLALSAAILAILALPIIIAGVAVIAVIGGVAAFALIDQ